MSAECVAQIIGRAFLDHGYRKLLLEDAAAALAEYSLTTEETQALRNIALERLASVEAALYERIALSLTTAEGEASTAAQEIVVRKLTDLFDELT